MKKIYIIIFSLYAFIWVNSEDKFKTIKSDDMTINYYLENERVYFKLSAPTKGWVSIGIDPSTKMKDANIIIGYVDNKGNVFIFDHYGTGFTQHTSDLKLNGTEDIYDKKGFEKDNFTEISFSIPLKSNDKNDKIIEQGKEYKVIVAYGNNDSVTSGHKYRKTLKILF